MSLLTDLFSDLIGSGLGPSADRGLVAMFTVGCVALASATAWLLATFPDPIMQPEWGLAVLAGSVLCGAGGLLVSSLHLRRNESDRAFGLLSLMVNAAAVAIPMVWMIAR